jgi:hypothetical protein
VPCNACLGPGGLLCVPAGIRAEGEDRRQGGSSALCCMLINAPGTLFVTGMYKVGASTAS